MSERFIKAPSSEEEWVEIADQFKRNSNFGNCIGTIDGKHVSMQAPPRSGSYFFNNKKTHSIVLMAVANLNYQSNVVDIGDAGCQSDCGVFTTSNNWQAQFEGLLNIAPPRCLYGDTKLFPFVLVGDEAFPLKENLIKLYVRAYIKEKEQVPNYRISQQRRVVENTFGICAFRFRIFRGL